MVGGVELAGGAAATAVVGELLAVAFPAELVPVTWTRTVPATSAEVSAYVEAVAPEMSEQFAPAASQRCHWYVKLIGALPVQVPLAAVSVCPSWAVPLIVGATVFAGGDGATAAACVLVAAVPPAAFVPVTTSRSVEATSLEVSTSGEPGAPPMSEQFA